MTAAVTEPDTRTAYDELAPFYDAFTAHHDYDAWTRSLVRLARRHGLRGRRLLDVGCGTGKSFIPLARRGWRVTACDISPEMLARAAAKAPPPVALHVADMRALPRLGPHDLVWSLDDAVNHLLDSGELVAALRGAAANLARGGVLVFDVNTLRTYRTFFADRVEVEAPGCTVVWEGETDRDLAAGGLARATITAIGPDGSAVGRPSRQRQRHHPRAVVLDALADAGLVALGTYGQDLAGRLEPCADEGRHTKAVYVARRRAPDDEGR
jgi:SAM-dependent methyltransferase